jgi:hypothetical protein
MKKGTLVALMAVTTCCTGAHAAEGRFVPPAGKILLFAGQSNKAIRNYVKATGAVPAGLMLYTSVQQVDALYEPSDCGGGECCGSALLREYPDAALQLGLYMVDALDAIADGVYDTNIDRIGAWIKDAKRPVYLRIGYEFDGPHNHYEPAAYVKAYRYIVDRFRRNGVDNAAYVWHSYAAFPPMRHLDWYPGDDYVDWFGITYFAQSEAEMKPVIVLAKEHGKPVMIAESSPNGIGTRQGTVSWQRWFKGYFDFIIKYDVRAFSYINDDWDSLPMFKDFHWKDARLNSNRIVRKKWNEETRKERYLLASKGLFALLGFTEEKR